VGDRGIGVLGLLIVAGSFGWSVAGGDGESITGMVIIGLTVVVADVLRWRSGAYGLDLAVPADRTLPAPAWGWLLGSAAVIGLVASVAAGAVGGAVIAGIALIATVVGPLRDAAPGRVPYQAAASARRIRQFVRAHGAAENEAVPGYLTGVGEPGVRLFVGAPDGAWTDVMAGRDADLVAELARVELRDQTDPASGRLVRVHRPFWTQMTASW
jgi:hypothetical protein